MPDVFLSYSRQDQATARRIAEALAREGFDVWWDQTLRSGETYDEVTENALKSAAAVVVLWSKSSVASRWVRAEATIADRKGTLLPAMIESCERPVMFELRQSADLSQWKGNPQEPAWQVFVDDVRQHVGKTSGEGAAPLRLGAAAVSQGARSWKNRILVPALAAMLALGGLAWWLSTRSTAEGSASARASAANVTTGRPYVLVVPFDLSAGATETWQPWADQVTGEVVRSLRRVSGLEVPEQSTVFAFAGNKDSSYIRSQLPQAQYVLRGAVTFGPDNSVRITPELEDLGRGVVIWDSLYEGHVDPERFFSMSSAIADAVSSSLKVIILDDERSALAELPTKDAEALRLYVEGQKHLRLFSRESLLQAMDYFDQAIKRDEKFFDAYLGRADAYRALFGYYDPPIINFPKAVEALKTAEALRPGSVEVLSRLGLIYAMAWDWKNAWETLNAAKQKGPDNALMELGFALYYCALGEAGKVKESLEIANRLDPLSVDIADWGHWALFMVGERDAARSWVDEKMRQHPTFGILRSGAGVAASIVGDNDRAVKLAEEGALLEPHPVAKLMLAQAYGYVGEKEKALQRIREAERTDVYTCPYESAVAYLSVGDRTTALAKLEESVPKRSNCLIFTRVDPRLAPLHREPRFQAVLKAVGLDDKSVASYPR